MEEDETRELEQALRSLCEAARKAAPAWHDCTLQTLHACREQLDELVHASSEPLTRSSSAEPVRSLDHLVFLIHGIGRHDDFMDDKKVAWDGSEGMHGGNHEYRELLESVISSRFSGVRVRLSVASVEWHSQLHKAERERPPDLSKADSSLSSSSSSLHATSLSSSTLGNFAVNISGSGSNSVLGGSTGSLAELRAAQRDAADLDNQKLLEACCPDGVSDLRHMTRETLMDIFYYVHAARGQQVVNAVAEQLRSKWDAFTAERPGYTGGVSLFAHSLGSVILYDMLSYAGRTVNGVTYPRLPFAVDCFFACGSPAALFLISRRRGRAPIPQPSCNAFFNIVNPADPVSYLTEPLLPVPGSVGALVSSPATRMWVRRNMRGARGRALPSARGLPPGASRAEALAWLRDNDSRGEVDHELLQSRWVVSDVLNAHRAHSSYWFSEEVALFMLTQLLAPWASSPSIDEASSDYARWPSPLSPPPPPSLPPTQPGVAPDGRTGSEHVCEPPPLDAQLSLQAAGPLVMRSEVTGLFFPVLALLQRGCLYVHGRAPWPLSPRGRIDLRGAAVSSPLDAGSVPSSRILVQARPSGSSVRAFEMVAADSAEASQWVHDIVSAILAASAMEAAMDGGGSGGGGGGGGGGTDGSGGGGGGSGAGGGGGGSGLADCYRVEAAESKPLVDDSDAEAPRQDLSSFSAHSFDSPSVTGESGVRDDGVSLVGSEDTAAERTLEREASDAVVRETAGRESPIGVAMRNGGGSDAKGAAEQLVAGSRCDEGGDGGGSEDAAGDGRSGGEGGSDHPSGMNGDGGDHGGSDVASGHGGGGGESEAPAASVAGDDEDQLFPGQPRDQLVFFGATRTGALLKRGDRRLASVRSRWFALQGHELLYYEKPPLAAKPRYCAHVASGEVRVNEAEMQLAVAVGDGSLIVLRAESAPAWHAWVRAMRALGMRVLAE